jgi:3-methyladenine DNA glycosylase AlkC
MRIEDVKKLHLKQLKAECEKVYRLSMPWADDILMEKLVEKRYLQIIETMDHEEYEKDLADLED